MVASAVAPRLPRTGPGLSQPQPRPSIGTRRRVAKHLTHGLHMAPSPRPPRESLVMRSNGFLNRALSALASIGEGQQAVGSAPRPPRLRTSRRGGNEWVVNGCLAFEGTRWSG